MKKQTSSTLPAELTYPVVVTELQWCHNTSFYTEEHDGAYQTSRPGADYGQFPIVVLTVEKSKGHFLEGDHPYLFARTDRLSERDYFLKIEGTIDQVAKRDERLLTVRFKAHTVQLKKQGNLSTKETWTVE